MAFVFSGSVAGSAWAQAYPNRPIRLIVPFPAGGGTDAFARPFTAQLTRKMPEKVVRTLLCVALVTAVPLAVPYDATATGDTTVAAVQGNGMIPILCVGETLAAREAGDTESKVIGQLEAALAGRSDQQVAGIVVAYEPVWAIGTDLTAYLFVKTYSKV